MIVVLALDRNYGAVVATIQPVEEPCAGRVIASYVNALPAVMDVVFFFEVDEGWIKYG